MSSNFSLPSLSDVAVLLDGNEVFLLSCRAFFFGDLLLLISYVRSSTLSISSFLDVVERYASRTRFLRTTDVRRRYSPPAVCQVKAEVVGETGGAPLHPSGSFPQAAAGRRLLLRWSLTLNQVAGDSLTQRPNSSFAVSWRCQFGK